MHNDDRTAPGRTRGRKSWFFALGGLALLACATSEQTETALVEVELCDGETKVALDEAPTTPEGGRAVADALMASWRAKNPDALWEDSDEPGQAPAAREADWEAKVRARHLIIPSADNSDVIADDGQGAGHSSSRFTARDTLIWKRETERFVVDGARIFHDSDELGSTIAVSCDMCHPDASNTHPETYPKFQVQLGKTALLRDMINWCVQHPVRGELLDPDGPRMRALEAYIIAQRKGAALNYGKH